MPVTDDYWRGVEPSYRFLKEFFRGQDRVEVNEGAHAGKTIAREVLDDLFLNEAIHFLRLSIINLLSYKYLVKGNYLAWSKVTLYYSYFYVINCLLRLQKFAIVHINYINDSPLTIIIDRSRDNRYYTMKNIRRPQHDLIWKTFEQYYPALMSKGIGKFFREDRIQWNYDLFYASKTLEVYALEEARDRETNFLDPNYGVHADPDAAEYYHDLMAGIGYEEVGVGELIKHAIEKFSNIGFKNIFSKENMDKIKSSEDTKKVILTWFENV